MDVLVSNGSVLRNGSTARYTQGRLGCALRRFFSAICVVVSYTGIQQQRSAITTALDLRNHSERDQHIRSFEFAYAYGRCRSEFRARAMRAVRR